MSTYETSITNPKKQLEFYKDLSEQLQQENKKLKNEIENNIKVNMADHKYASECEDKVVTLEAHQKEFIKYLEDEIERKSKNATCMFEYNDTVLPLKEVLQEYKEIIGVEDENKRN